jgi:hypothetical protein
MKESFEWDDITIERYQEIQNIIPDPESPYTTDIERLSIVLDMDPTEIRSINIRDYSKLRDKVSPILDKSIPKTVKLRFKLEDIEYGFIPNLTYFTAGEIMDTEGWKNDVNGNIHYYAALLFRPITISRSEDDYEIEEHKISGFEKRAALFKEKLPITYCYGSTLFFLSGAMASLKTIQDYLIETQTL